MLEVVCVFVPVLGAWLVHVPILRWDLLPALRRPIDGGRTWRGRRLLGDNKTWRGALAMGGGVLGLTVVLSLWRGYWSRLPPALQHSSPWLVGALLGLGTVAAELPNSFVKRQLDIAPGRRQRSPLGALISLYDQGDFVLGIWVALLPLWAMSASQALVAFVLVAVVHVAVSWVAWRLGARTTPL